MVSTIIGIEWQGEAHLDPLHYDQGLEVLDVGFS